MDKIQAIAMFERAMKAVKAEMGDDYTVELTEKRLGDGSISFNMKIEQVIINGRQKADIAREQWDKHCNILGVPKEWFGQNIRIGKSMYTITALLPERPKNCIRICNTKGKEYITNIEQVKQSLALYKQ